MRFSQSTHLLIHFVHHKEWPICSGGTDRLMNSVIIFGSLIVTLTVLLFWIDLFLLILVFVLYNGFPSTGKFWSCCCFSFHWLSNKLKMWCPVSLHSINDYFWADWESLCDHLRDVPWENIFKLNASATASEFWEWIQIGIDVDIPHCKYQVKTHSSLWFSASFAAAIIYIKHFFCLYQQSKSFESKVKFRQASNCSKRVLEAAKLVC